MPSLDPASPSASSRRSRTWMAAVAGIGVGSVLAVAMSAGTSSPSAAPSAPLVVTAAASTPPRVAVISKLLDAFATGAAAGPGVLNGVVATVIGSQQIPPPGDQVQAEAIQSVVDIGAQITKQGPVAIDEFRAAIAPMACANPAINAGIEAFANALDGVSNLGATIAPLDVTAAETATLIRGFEAPATTC